MSADGKCPVCGHLWRQHDPEDGKCDAGMPKALGHEGLGVCPCGRELGYHRRRNAALSKEALRA